ncbi:MAG: molybdopterin-dependent oxidoreductase [Alphaproteobacteria bacterium]|nr:molybdopterin-dependent oxidoreductase [Alphaproteobacteria bacterium]
MSLAGTIARRTFLIASTAIAGGVAFGVYAVKKPHPNPLLNDLAEGEAAFNPWVKITSHAIILVTPHTDLGQGARSVQAALIAEELDLEWGQFEVSAGEPAAAYYNSALGEENAPYLSTDDSFAASATRTAMAAVFKLLAPQVTGGSSTVPDSFLRLREAGATARETLKKAASRKTGVPAAELSTAAGNVVLPDGSRIPYTELAAEAAKLAPVQGAKLREPNEWRLIGKPMQRLDIVAKSTGALKYGIDLRFDGMVYAAVRTNPRQGGELLSYDAAAAEAMPGVRKVVAVKNGVAVIATSTWRAFKAVDAIECEWGPAPYPAEMRAHWDAVSNSFTEEFLDKVWRDEGDVEAALAGEILEAEYRAPYLAHQPLEPLSAIVKVSDDGVDIWVGHQVPGYAEQRVAAIAGVDVENVHLHNQYVGGSFGHRLEFENVDRAAEIAVQMKGVPVKLTYTREEDFLHDFPRQIAMSRGRGAVKDGRIEALDLSIASVSSSDSQSSRLGQTVPGPDNQIPAGAWTAPYAIPNFRVSAYKTPPLAPTSSWRSVGASTGGFFADCFLDELIHAAGADALEARIAMCKFDVPRKVLEAVGEMSNWGADLGPGRGRGVAYVESFGVPVAEVVDVSVIDDRIRVDRVFVAADVGRIVDPINFDNHVKGAVVWGLGHAINCEITYSDGMAQQTNYHAFEGMRIYNCPEIIVRGLETAEKIRGIGEPPVPPAAPALANAIFAATGKRLREMPFNKFVKFI